MTVSEVWNPTPDSIDNLRDERAAAGGDDHLLRLDAGSVVNDQLMRTDEAGMSLVDGEIRRLTPRPASCPRGLVYSMEDPVSDGRPIGPRERGRQAEARRPLDLHGQVSRVGKHLRRYTAPVDAGAPEGTGLDERDLGLADVVWDRHVSRT